MTSVNHPGGPIWSADGATSPDNAPGAVLLAWVVGLSVVGYPIAGLLAAVLSLESTVTSIPFRLIVVAIAGLAVLSYTAVGGRFRLNQLVLLFWWLYGIRLVFDVGQGVFDTVDRDALFFVAAVVLPGLAMMIVGRHFDERSTAAVIFGVGLIVSLGSILLNALGIRAELDLTQVTGRLSYTTINSITLGHVAASTTIAAFTLWTTARTPLLKGVLLAGAILSLTLLVLAAARGPLLALVLAAGFYLVVRGRWGAIAAVGLLMLFLVPSLVAAQGLSLVRRFSNLYEDLSVLERLDIQANAIDQFLANPLLGSAYTELISGQYPHNTFIEALMALGIAGFLVYLVIVVSSGVMAFSQLRRGAVLLPMMFIQYFINAQLSDSIWGGAAFWSVMVLLFAQQSLGRAPDRDMSAGMPWAPERRVV